MDGRDIDGWTMPSSYPYPPVCQVYSGTLVGVDHRALLWRLGSTVSAAPAAPIYPGLMGAGSIHDRAWVAARLANGETVTAIARDAGVSRQTAHAWIARHRLSRTPTVKARPSRLVLARLYREHRSVAKTAAMLEVSAETARRWLIDAGIDLAQPGRPSVTIDKVAELRRRRAAGATYQALAAEYGVPLETLRRRLTGGEPGQQKR